MKSYLIIILLFTLLKCTLSETNVFISFETKSSFFTDATAGVLNSIDRAKFPLNNYPNLLYVQSGSTIYQYNADSITSSSSTLQSSQSWTLSSQLIPNLQSTEIIALGNYGNNILLLTAKELVYIRIVNQTNTTYQRVGFTSLSDNFKFFIQVYGEQLFGPGSQIGFNIIDPTVTRTKMLFYKVDEEYQMQLNRTYNPGIQGNQLNFLSYDGINGSFIGTQGIIYSFNPFSQNVPSSFNAGNLNRVVGLPDIENNVVYMCSNTNNFAVMNTAVYRNTTTIIGGITYNFGESIGAIGCINGVFNSETGQIFFTVYDINNILGIVVINAQGTVNKFSWLTNEIVNPTTLKPSSYPITISPSGDTLYIISPSGSLYYIGFTSFCEVDACSGHGSCFGSICKCDSGYIKSDCSILQPIITTIDQSVNLQSTSISISGQHITNEYTSVSIGGTQCSNTYSFPVSGLYTIVCTNVLFASTVVPYQKQSVVIQYSGYTNAPFEYQFIKVPQVKNVTLSTTKTSVSIIGIDFYNMNFMGVSLADQVLECQQTIAKTQIECILTTLNNPSDNLTLYDTNTPPTIYETYSFKDQALHCPKNCSNHGACDYFSGKCICEVEYRMNPDCSLNPTKEPEEVSSTIKIQSSHYFITLLLLLLISIIFN